MEDIRDKLRDVSEITDNHVWSLDGEYNILTIHLQLDKNYKLSEQAKLKEIVRSQLIDESINHITIEFEGQDENCGLQSC